MSPKTRFGSSLRNQKANGGVHRTLTAGARASEASRGYNSWLAEGPSRIDNETSGSPPSLAWEHNEGPNRTASSMAYVPDGSRTEAHLGCDHDMCAAFGGNADVRAERRRRWDACRGHVSSFSRLQGHSNDASMAGF